MHRLCVATLTLCVALYGCTAVEHAPAIATPALVHHAQSTALDLTVGQETFAGAISLPLDDVRTKANIGAGNEPVLVCLVEGERKTCLTVRPDEPADLAIDYQGDVRTLVLSYLGTQASFSPAYQAAHRGKLDIEVPMAYELVNVAIALTLYAHENPGLVASSDYLEDVRTYFAAQTDHAFVRALDQAMREDGDYHMLKMNGAAFEVGEDATVSRSSVYKSTSWGENALLPMMAEMQDFARVTNFPRFYDAHRALYASQIAYLRDDVDVDGMLSWLVREFPDVTPYDHTRILFSPLVGYNQSLKTFDADGFRQLMPHVNYPYPEKGDAVLSSDALALYRGFTLFTELNHGFINPTIDPRSSAIQAAMPDIAVWAGNETAQSYGSSTAIFTEMVNWALVSVRAYDVLPEDEAATIANRVERIMVDNRGFTRFAAFQRCFLDMSRARGNSTIAETISALIRSLPRLLADQNCGTDRSTNSISSTGNPVGRMTALGTELIYQEWPY